MDFYIMFYGKFGCRFLFTESTNHFLWNLYIYIRYLLLTILCLTCPLVLIHSIINLVGLYYKFIVRRVFPTDISISGTLNTYSVYSIFTIIYNIFSDMKFAHSFKWTTQTCIHMFILLYTDNLWSYNISSCNHSLYNDISRPTLHSTRQDSCWSQVHRYCFKFDIALSNRCVFSPLIFTKIQSERTKFVIRTIAQSSATYCYFLYIF